MLEHDTDQGIYHQASNMKIGSGDDGYIVCDSQTCILYVSYIIFLIDQRPVSLSGGGHLGQRLNGDFGLGSGPRSYR